MKKIFLVDDSATILMSMTEILHKAGFHVDTAVDGEAALAKLNMGLKPDLIITDINMPKMNGLEFMQAARKLPAFRFTPILVLTTETQQEKRDKARAMGATGWLVKPVGGNDVVKIIKQVLPGA